MFWWIFGLFLNFNTLGELATWSNRNPQKASYWLEQHIFYESREKWENPDEIFTRRACDCKGFAGMFLRVVNDWDIAWDQAILSVEAEDKAHAVCVFWYKGQYCFFDQKGITYTREVKVAEVAKHVYEDWTLWRLYKDEMRTELLQWETAYE